MKARTFEWAYVHHEGTEYKVTRTHVGVDKKKKKRRRGIWEYAVEKAYEDGKKVSDIAWRAAVDQAITRSVWYRWVNDHTEGV